MPKTTVLAGLVSSEASVLGLKKLPSSCVLLWSFLCAPASLVSVCVQIFSSYEDTSWVVLGSS